MSTRLRWYVGTSCVAGGLVLAFLLTRLDLDRAREVAGAIAVFAAFVVVGELVTLRVDDKNRLKEISLPYTFPPGRHHRGRACVHPRLGRGRPDPAPGRGQDAVQRRPVRARPGRRRGHLPRPPRRL